MYRNVYWHHAVRSATAMYKRLVDGALRAGLARARRRSRPTPTRDCSTSSRAARPAHCSPRCASGASTSASSSVPPPSFRPRAASGSPTTARSSSRWRIASRARLGLAPGELLLDYPTKTQMLGLDIPVLRRDGSVRRLTAEGWEGAINLPKLSEELYRSARWLRVFACRPVAVSREAITRLATLPASEVRDQLERGSLLGA